MRFGKAAVAAVLVAAAVTVCGCDGPLMMSDEKTEKTEKAQPDQGGTVKDPGAAGDRME
ncbi:MAG TPA: hypothetical protein VGO66_04025 [Solirubrobacterales bacterium]|jgi:predicted small lipoprotein YifL|nr:hypothetical protein [Solirubrobacterales bacterium]